MVEISNNCNFDVNTILLFYCNIRVKLDKKTAIWGNIKLLSTKADFVFWMRFLQKFGLLYMRREERYDAINALKRFFFYANIVTWWSFKNCKRGYFDIIEVLIINSNDIGTKAGFFGIAC